MELEIKEIIKTRNRRLLMFIIGVFLIGISSFLVEGHTLSLGTARVPLTNIEFWLGFFIVLCFMVVFVFLAFRFYSIKLQPFLIYLFGVLFIGGVIALIVFPGVYDVGYLLYMPTTTEKIRYCAGFFIEVSSLFLLFSIFPQVLRGQESLKWFFYGLILNAFIAILYSYIKEAPLYIKFLKGNAFDSAYDVPVSFTGNRNVFSRLLFYALIAEAYFQCLKPKVYRWVVILFLYFNQVFILSKATIVISTIFLLGFAGYRFVKTLKEHSKRNWITLGVIVGLSLLFIIFQFAGMNAMLFPKIDSSIKKGLYWIGESFGNSFDLRWYTWFDVFREQVKNPLTLFFGYGPYSYMQAVDAICPPQPGMPLVPLDGAYISILVKNGILGVLVCFFLLVYVVKLLINSYKRKSRLAVPLTMTLCCFTALSFFENLFILSFSSSSIFLLIAVVLVLATEDHYFHHPALKEETTSSVPLVPIKRKEEASSDIVLRISSSISFILFGILVFAGKGLMRVKPSLPFSFSALTLIGLSLCFLVFPLLIHCIFSSKEKMKPLLFRLLIIGSIVLGFIGLLGCFNHLGFVPLLVAVIGLVGLVSILLIYKTFHFSWKRYSISIYYICWFIVFAVLGNLITSFASSYPSFLFILTAFLSVIPPFLVLVYSFSLPSASFEVYYFGLVEQRVGANIYRREILDNIARKQKCKPKK